MKDNKRSVISAIQLSSYNETLPVERYTAGGGYVYWGEDDRYPEFLYSLYRNSSTLGSIINVSANMTTSVGFANNTGMQEENRFGETVEDIIEKQVLDGWIFGGFALQIVYNKLGKIIEVCYIDPMRIRLSKEGNIFVAEEWQQGNASKRYNRMKSFDPETGAEDGVQIAFYKGKRTRGIYPTPDYEAAITDAETQVEIKRFNFNEINNNFLSSAVFNFNNGIPEEDEQKAIEKKVNERFGGAKNTARILTSFNESKENALTIDRIATDDLPDRYTNIADQVMKNIFISLAAHPQLFGMAVNTGFAQIEYSESYNLYEICQLIPRRKEIERFYKKIFGFEAIVFNQRQKEVISDESA